MSKETVRGTHLTLTFDSSRCVHSRNCVLSAPAVFRANIEGPWIHPDAMPVEDLIAVARQCPSGAIEYQRHDGGAEETAPPVNVLRVRENGPLAVTAQIELSAGGQTCSATRLTLCRCGHSKNKPFCDGAHATAGFVATGEPDTRASEPLAARDGVLGISAAPNGPLLVTGNLEICSGTGRTVDRVSKCALCRCGESKNKPFCDGSHRVAGFTAP
ncbi:MAG: CDGSH iron-sulfur domain-containing protein [Myxococcales bacterium]|nr:CDGSH iron-sulfur domain-containing protein [Myxococcales bacterium]